MKDKPKHDPCSACWSALDTTVITLATQALALAGLERLLADAGTREAAQLASLIGLIRANVQAVTDALSQIASAM